MGMDTTLTISIHEVPSSWIFPNIRTAIASIAMERPILEFKFDDEKTNVFTQDNYGKAVMFPQIDFESSTSAISEAPKILEMWDDGSNLILNHMNRDGPWWSFMPGGRLKVTHGEADWRNYSVGAFPYSYNPCKHIEFMENKNVAGGIWDNKEAFNVLRSIEAFALLVLRTSEDEKLMKELDKPQTSLLRIPKGWSPLSAAYRSKKLTYLTLSDFYPTRLGSLWLWELRVEGEDKKGETEQARSIISTMRALQKRVKSGKSTIMTQFLIDVNMEGHKFEDVPIEDRPFIDGRQASAVK
jgi:hypothetical protein